MKLNKIEISNFRSIKKGSFVVDKIIGIVGQNNSGKTAVLRALNSFFNPNIELQHFISGVNLYSNNSAVPQIIAKFQNIPDKHIYSQYTADGMLTIKQRFIKSKNKLEYYILKNGKFETAPETLIKEFNRDIQYILIPADRNLNLNNENSLLKELLHLFFINHTSKRDTLTPKVKDAFDYLNKNALKKVAQGIEGRYLTNKGFNVSISSNTQVSYELLLSGLEIFINEDGKEFNLNDCGSGVQSLVAIAIYRYSAELKLKSFIIGLEEPETNLHPQGQKELMFSLLEQLNSSFIQVLFTTHSTVLVDQLDHTDIILVRKIEDDLRSFKTKLVQLRKNFWTYYDLEKIQYDKFHKFCNSEFFFANHVIVTESPIDSNIINKLCELNNISLERKGVSIVELDGIKNLKYAFHLLKELEIPKTLIVDKDFFFEYQNGDKEKSRYQFGFFNYRNDFRNEPLIQEIIKDKSAKNQLEALLTNNHSKALDILEKFEMISFKYNLEMDLIASKVAQDILYNEFNIDPTKRNTFEILVNHKKAIKKIDTLFHIINNLPKKNLPNSYKRLLKRFSDI